MRFHLSLQRNNLKANETMEILMTLISRNHGRMKMNFFHLFIITSDYKSMTEPFSKKGNDRTLDNFIPKSESDFMEYAELFSHKLCPYKVSLTIFLSLHCRCIEEVLTLPKYIL
ncbi:hypothetical protein ES288_D06G147400v1 [Gossypium darwinii]|uniref:Uncharacterized protein n=1 Tax=Gossypium darwinii TaxID=34276 RepID=A0A5D2C9E6_GOSDA|nr:hypothetical protein ES288_D06G147400v1 [Gossypium darwinii]